MRIRAVLVTILCLFALAFGYATAGAQTTAQKNAVRATLEVEFAKFPKPHTAVQSAAILNAAALANPGWVLLGKKGGNRCPLSDGRDISCDFLVFEATKRGWDVIGSVGAPNSSISGPNASAGEDMTPSLANGSRTLERPVGSAPPVDPPVDPPVPPVDLTPILNRLSALEAANSVLLEEINRLKTSSNEATSRLGSLDAGLSAALERLFRLEQKPWPALKCSGRVSALFGLPIQCNVVPDVNP